ncbi:MAG: RagB/SusD family nutrient uptake outer membrane protein [Chitinophagaceae bacterium]|nr:RagB/SusD family nutrient uptake outer membrane protein [Chitinophagaceae bacterium]
MYTKKIMRVSIVLMITGILISCKKYLDIKPDKSLAIISTLEDMQSILDIYLYVNYQSSAALEASADDYYVTENNWGLYSDVDRNMYLWEKSNLFPEFEYSGNEWSQCYDNVYRANSVLEHIDKINKSTVNINEWNNIKGQALFLRGRSFFQAVSVWSLAYDSSSADTDLGIPLRLDGDFNKKSFRLSVRQSYNQIIEDLKLSAELLPDHPLHVLRSSKAAAFALLSRVYLSMRQYPQARLYADSALRIKNTLMDYNGDVGVNTASQAPFSKFNPEVIYEEAMSFNYLIYTSYAKIDSILYSSYAENDLRKSLFFRDNGDGSFGFRGYYSQYNPFDGLATDELYLIRSECSIREGDIDAALSDLNTLLIKRWVSGTFTPLTANSIEEALSIILAERRKELVFRGRRWLDVKRMNKEGKNIVLMRNINGKVYTLLSNDLRYALPIPETVIQLSGMQQNPR